MQTTSAFVMSLALATVLCSCAEPAPGPVLSFVEVDGNDDGILYPLAAGRSTRFDVTPLSFLSRRTVIDMATSSDESVLTVESIQESSLTVRAHSKGWANLTVSMKTGLKDVLTLEVRDEERLYLLARTDARRNVIDSSGAYNLAPGDVLTVDRFIFADAQGSRLSGLGAVEFGAVEKTGAMRLETSAKELVVHAGNSGDRASVVTPHGTLRFRTLETLTTDDLTAVVHEEPHPKKTRAGTTFEVQPDGYVIHFLPLDADGYAYVGGHALDMTVELTNAEGWDFSSAQNPCTRPTGNRGCAKFERLAAGTLEFTTVPGTKGTASVVVTVGDVSKAFTLEALVPDE